MSITSETVHIGIQIDKNLEHEESAIQKPINLADFFNIRVTGHKVDRSSINYPPSFELHSSKTFELILMWPGHPSVMLFGLFHHHDCQ